MDDELDSDNYSDLEDWNFECSYSSDEVSDSYMLNQYDEVLPLVWLK